MAGPSHEMADEEDIQYVFGDTLNNLPNVHVEFENDGPSSYVKVIPVAPRNPPKRPLRSIENEINNALFDNQDNGQDNNQNVQNIGIGHNKVVVDDLRWNLPKLKVPKKGEPISQSLAELINMACTSQCDTNDIVNKYNLPANCHKLAPLFQKNFLGLSPPLATCETSQVLLADVSGGFSRGSPVFAPPTDWLVSYELK